MGARKRPRPNWSLARKLFEREGKSFTEIAEKLGISRNTIARHAKAGAWIDGATLARETSSARREVIFRDFIERDAEAIRANLSEKHRATRRVLGLVQKRLDKLESGTGDLAEALELQRIAGTIGRLEAVDSRLAGLADDGWRSAGRPSDPDSSAESGAVSDALAELEEEAARGR